MALGRYNIGSLSHRPDGSRAVSPSLPTGGSSSLDLRWDPEMGPRPDLRTHWCPSDHESFLPCLSLARAHMTHQSSAVKKTFEFLLKLETFPCQVLSKWRDQDSAGALPSSWHSSVCLVHLGIRPGNLPHPFKVSACVIQSSINLIIIKVDWVIASLEICWLAHGVNYYDWIMIYRESKMTKVAKKEE